MNKNETDNLNTNKEPDQNDQVISESFYWAETRLVDDIYGCIVFWRRNLFNQSSGGAGKEYIKELTRLTNFWKERSKKLTSCRRDERIIDHARLPSSKTKQKTLINPRITLKL